MKIVRIILETLLWLAAFAYFLKNAFLRPMQPSAIEAFVLSIIAVIVYADKFLFMPFILLRNRQVSYILVSCAAVLGAAFTEFLMVKPSIISSYAEIFSNKLLKDYLHAVFLNICLRDCAFYVFFLILHFNGWVVGVLSEERKTLSNVDRKYVIMLRHNRLMTLDVDKIIYVHCEGNRSFIHMNNGQSYRQYASLSMIENTLSKDKCLRINRKTLVLYDSIDFYTSEAVHMHGIEEPLPFFLNQPEKVLARLLLWNKNKYRQFSTEKSPKKHDLAGLGEILVDESRPIGGIGPEFLEENPDEISNHEQLGKVAQYIRLHPGCKISDISTGTGLKSRTVERLVHDLKTDGRICHRGSKRYGGYEAVEGEMGNEEWEMGN